MKTAAATGAAIGFSSTTNSLFADTKTGQLPPQQPPKDVAMIQLPYAQNSLAPSISARTINLHYNQHHMSYYTMLKGWINVHPEYQNQTLTQLIQANKNGIRIAEAVFRYSILLNNHNWYWASLTPNGGGAPKGRIAKLINDSYGSYDAFKKTFIEEGTQLGIGWVWTVLENDKIKVYLSEYGDTPILRGYQPLLAIDVWEHAYYLDYQNERQKYLEAVLDKLLNWDFAESNLPKAK